MFYLSNIRSILPSDLTKLKVILDQVGLFPAEMLDDMIDPFFSDTNSDVYWHTYEHCGEPIALLFCEKERITESTWNILAIAVKPTFQSQGIGELMMKNIEQALRTNNQSTLIVETSSLPEYERTRKFYDRIGYDREAVIRDFYSPGDNKVVFWKTLR